MTGHDVVHAPAGPGLAQLLERARFGSYFEVLGLTRDASFGEVARRARELMLLLDRAASEPAAGLEANELEEIRWSVREAWRVLSDPELRERFSLGLARLADDLEGACDGPTHD
ncbi:MAG: hypothetical protein ABIK09_17125 [Pseudomonadota bacterium]